MTRRSPGARANAKGKRGQTEAKNYLISLGFDAVNCAAHGVTGGQDLKCNDLPNVWIEVKFGVQGMDLHTKLLRDAWEQAYEVTKSSGVSCRFKGEPIAYSKKACVLWHPPRTPWRLTWMDECGLVTTTGDAEIKSALLRLNGGR